MPCLSKTAQSMFTFHAQQQLGKPLNSSFMVFRCCAFYLHDLLCDGHQLRIIKNAPQKEESAVAKVAQDTVAACSAPVQPNMKTSCCCSALL